MRATATLVSIAAGLLAVPAAAETFIDVGANRTDIKAFLDKVQRANTTDQGIHLGVGVRRSFGERHDIGARLEWDDIGDTSMLAVRAIDYRWHFGSRFAIGGFLGAARLDLATPAFGYYVGVGLDWTTPLPKWDLGVDFHYGDKVARDNLPDNPEVDSFRDVQGFSLYLSRRF